MQDWNDCLNMNIGDVTALTDSRDNDTYAIAKLADGKCWMIENLRLDDSVVLSSSNTNNPSLPLTNIYDTSVTSNHLSSSSSLAYNATIAPEGWCTVDSSACNDQSRLRTDNTTLFTNNTASAYSADSNVYSYGNYYNWYSATAGHGKYGSSYGVNYHAPGDVCPAGWHLPTGGGATDDFNLLDNALGAGASSNSNQYRSYPNNFVYSGKTYSSSISYRNSDGSYWSSDAASSTFVGFLYYDDTYVGAAVSSVNKYYGFTVRCVFGV